MNFAMPDFGPAAPEMFVLTMACAVLVVDLFLSEKTRSVTYLLAQATVLGALVLTLGLYDESTRLTFSGTFVLDPMASVLKAFIYLSVFVVFVYSRSYLADRGLFQGEFYLLGLFATLGMMVMVSAHSLLTVYLGLELMSLALYAMVALQRDSSLASEAAMKYFVLGAIASAMLLYGMSMLYGVSGSLDLDAVNSASKAVGVDSFVLVFGLVFVVVGVAFKLGAVPFHMWVPDIYHGAPTAVTLFVSTAPKIAAFAILMRLLVDGLGGLSAHWTQMLMILTVLSLVIGNVVAIAQTNIKRMLAYSGISHIGFLMMGVLTGNQDGFAASMFYAIVYAIMGLGSFGMVVLLSRAGFEADNLDDFKGLSDRSPWFALMMLITLFSLAGVPPFLGFWAKLAVLQAAVDAGLLWLAVTGVILSVVGAFYYLRIIKLMYFDKPVDQAALNPNIDLRVALSINSLAVLVVGLYPSALLTLCGSAVSL